jgi:hypothetical protein
MLAEGISRLAEVIRRMQGEENEPDANALATEGQAKEFW